MKQVIWLVFLLIFSRQLIAQEINITKVIYSCVGGKVSCKEFSNYFNVLKGTFVSFNHLDNVIKKISHDGGIKSLNYDVVEKKNGEFNLVVELITNIYIDIIEFDKKSFFEEDLTPYLSFREDEYVTQEIISKSMENIRELLVGKGYPQAVINYKFLEVKGKNKIIFYINKNKSLNVKSFQINSNNYLIKKTLLDRFSRYRHGPFNLQKIKDELVELRLDLQNMGHYLINISLKYKMLVNDEVELIFDVSGEDIYVFDFKGAKKISNYDLKKRIADIIKSGQRAPTDESIKQFIAEQYALDGVFSNHVSIITSRYKDIRQSDVNQYLITIKEMPATKLKKIVFKGNRAISNSELINAYNKLPSELVEAQLYNQILTEEFTEKIRQIYLAKGFLSVSVDRPVVKNEENFVVVEYAIKEGMRSYVSNINIPGVDEKLARKIIGVMLNRAGGAFNPLELEMDIKKVEDYLFEDGYYYSKIRNKDASSLVKYYDDNTRIEINFEIETGNKQRINQIYYVGARKTRKKLIQRYIKFKEGETLVKSKLQNSQSNLLAIGLFGDVEIEPVEIAEGQSDIIVHVKEKDFGIIEIAPGFRSDLGPKISGSISYLNFDGMGKQIIFSGILNQRMYLQSLDERRRKESQSLVEYNTSIRYNENNIFNSDVDFSTSISTSRARLYSFDADITGVNYTLSQKFNSWFKASITHQIEAISQFDATLERDNGRFRIGAIEPTLTFDFRNNALNPTSGAYFSISSERASPAFGSLNSNDIEIDYVKTMTRNRFYLPINRLNSIAMLVSYGKLENLSTSKYIDSDGNSVSRGYVPNIKMFRLSGLDTVRGFDDNEINRIPMGDEISNIRVDGTAYLVNLKFEPRFKTSESTVFALFYDAGGLFVGAPDMNHLRSSVGVSFKYLTPLGSLDFDYGIKLLRKRDPDGNLETPGRLHVSIGFF